MSGEQSIGYRLKELRQKLNLRQTALANQTGVSKSFVSIIESGTRLPSCELMLSLSQKYNVNLHWLLLGEGHMFRNYEPEPESKEQKLRKIYPGLPNNPRIDELVESLQVPVMEFGLLSDYLVKRKEYQSFIDDYFKGESNEGSKTQSG